MISIFLGANQAVNFFGDDWPIPVTPVTPVKFTASAAVSRDVMVAVLDTGRCMNETLPESVVVLRDSLMVGGRGYKLEISLSLKLCEKSFDMYLIIADTFAQVT